MVFTLFEQFKRRRERVRDEVAAYREKYGDQAHAVVLEKLQRKDLTSRYAAFLRDVERASRPGKSADIAQAGKQRADRPLKNPSLKSV